MLRFAGADYRGPTEERHDSRFHELIKGIDEILRSNDFFRGYSTLSLPSIQRQIAGTSLSWLFCDASLIITDITDITERGWTLTYDLLDVFSAWCFEISVGQLSQNESLERGYFDHQQLILQRPVVQSTLVGVFQTQFMTFLGQLNLSYTPTVKGDEYLDDTGIQADAFQYFASILESTLAAIPHPTGSEDTDDLPELISHIDLGRL